MYKCKYCGKEYETISQLGGHGSHCKMNPTLKREKVDSNKMSNGIKSSLKFIYYNDINNICNCQYCQKECKGLNSLKQHEIRCNNNPNKFINPTVKGKHWHQKHKNFIPWNKGLTKETDNRVKKSAESLHNKFINGELKIWCDGLTAETDSRIAKLIQTQKQNGKCGGYRENAGCFKHGKYNGIHCDSTWELAYILYCNDHNITIKRCDKTFEYFDNNGEKHIYYPDFIINDNQIVEIKGRITEKWLLKLPIVEKEHILVLYKEDMKDILAYCIKKYGNDLSQLYDKKN